MVFNISKHNWIIVRKGLWDWLNEKWMCYDFLKLDTTLLAADFI